MNSESASTLSLVSLGCGNEYYTQRSLGCAAAFDVLTSPVTRSSNTAEPGQTWSREAIFALVTIFVMVLLSGIGLTYKHRSKFHMLWKCGRWGKTPTHGIPYSVCSLDSHS